jgi:hypothetical protein
VATGSYLESQQTHEYNHGWFEMQAAYTQFASQFASDFLPEATCENPFWYICPRSCGLVQENLWLSAIWDCLKRPQVHEKHEFLNPVILEVSNTLSQQPQ